MTLLHKIGKKPIIAALRDPKEVETAIKSNVDNIFFMGGNVQEVIKSVKLAKASNKGAFVHLDLIKGLSSVDKEVIEFVSEYIGVDGIITPKSHLVREAKKANLYGILHLFVLDSNALYKGKEMVANIQPDGIEIMPGILSKATREFSMVNENIPVIASGLIQSKAEVSDSLQAGATSLSVSEKDLWDLTFDELFIESNKQSTVDRVTRGRERSESTIG
ncbi:glycerol-3-phosphate responsive antiterminator [Bacillus sp. Marseille-P3661]|uniref:glycerol-3-phosphate responsive antiterminator n=1 Tax=Bacillus sp. Marseille-P3661 TaxID=1936234 RepID=UPI000C8624DA|nr:glycerol-3-phosphate responsive antiterminator [Bacillus sp. Marseille-P3661]